MNNKSDKCSQRIASVVFAVSLLSGCASNIEPFTSPVLSPVNLDFGASSGELVPKVENFVMILDATSSMSIPYQLPAFNSSSKLVAEN